MLRSGPWKLTSSSVMSTSSRSTTSWLLTTPMPGQVHSVRTSVSPWSLSASSMVLVVSAQPSNVRPPTSTSPTSVTSDSKAYGTVPTMPS
jgi:hypothetical protein